MKYPRPIKPLYINQRWGIYRPEVYKQFGFSRHNGVDYAHGKTKKICAPFDGTTVRTGNQPNGGGIFFGVINSEGTVLLDFLHCEKIITNEGDTFRKGELLAIQGNTGFSTGPHTHIQARKIDNWNGKFGEDLYFNMSERNDANNSFDPETLWDSTYAEDIKDQTFALYLQSKIESLRKLLAASIKK